MARHCFLLTLALCSGLLSGVIQAQEKPSPSPSASPSPTPDKLAKRPPKLRDGRDFRDPRFKEMRERFEKMPEEQRQKALDKFRKWQQMPGDEQAHFRFMQGEREKRAQQAVDETLQASGLKLDEAQKQKFTEIYKQERRKLEESLRVEMDRRRQERLPELQKAVVDAYQKEIVSPTPSPSPSVTP